MNELPSEIFVIDDQHPEDNAMMQALYSRSPNSVTEHLKKVKQVGSGKFMDQFYVGYGHQSIGDCGTTTLYIENVSMLAAKAIQDSPLYNGQEASTRYIDMSLQEILNPLGHSDGSEIQNRWMAFYNAAMGPTIEHLRERYPKQDGEDEKQYDRAIKARAFDILRSFIPAGCTTNLSFHTTLRHAGDHLANLRHHPTREINWLAHEITAVLQKAYPHSFPTMRYEETEDYLALCAATQLYAPTSCPEEVICTPNLRADPSWHLHPAIKNRPPKCRVPHRFDSLGQITYEFLLDFGSFRDLQRHRNGVCEMPLLTTTWGFNKWYLDNLPPGLLDEARALIDTQTRAIQRLKGSDVEKQYYVAMGFNVPCRVTRGLPGTLYLIELRTSNTVHPTMRKVAQEMARKLLRYYPGLTLHADLNPDTWDIRRGAQHIERK